MLVFENRGAEVGATITHPHGQIYAFDFVPEAPLRELERGSRFDEPGDRLVATSAGWRAWVPDAPVFPYALLLVPDEQVPDLPSLGDAGRRGLAAILVDVLGATRSACSTRRRRTCSGSTSDRSTAASGRARGCTSRSSRPGARPDVPRYVAAGELGSGVYFNPVAPEAAAAVAARGGRGPSMTTALDRLLLPGGQPSWESPELQSLNRLPARATLVSYPTPDAALALAGPSPLRRSLDGAWEFRLVDRPAAAAAAARARRGWDRVDVPGLWTMQGYEQPHYTNVVMPFRDAPPHVPEANPTGIYRRSFTIPRGWRGRRVVLGFGGVEGVLHVLVNGEPVGISKDARTPAEFDVTDVVRHRGPNELVAVVVRWSDASFIEDQDQWWHAGISREVYLRSDRIEDVFVTATLDDDYRNGLLSRQRRGGRAARGDARRRRGVGLFSPATYPPGSRCARRASGRRRILRSTRSS